MLTLDDIAQQLGRAGEEYGWVSKACNYGIRTIPKNRCISSLTHVGCLVRTEFGIMSAILELMGFKRAGHPGAW